MSKKISKQTIRDFMKSYIDAKGFVVDYNLGEGTFQVEVKATLTPEEKGVFVERVARACFDDEENYRPEYKDPLFQVTLLQMLTNVPIFTNVQDGAEVVDIEQTHKLAKALQISNQGDKDFQDMLNNLITMIDDKIEYIKNAKNAKTRLFEVRCL